MNRIDEKSKSIIRWGNWMSDLVFFCHVNDDTKLLQDIFQIMDKSTNVIEDKVQEKYGKTSFDDAYSNFVSIVKDLAILEVDIDNETKSNIERDLRLVTDRLQQIFDESRLKSMNKAVKTLEESELSTLFDSKNSDNLQESEIKINIGDRTIKKIVKNSEKLKKLGK